MMQQQTGTLVEVTPSESPIVLHAIDALPASVGIVLGYVLARIHSRVRRRRRERADAQAAKIHAPMLEQERARERGEK